MIEYIIGFIIGSWTTFFIFIYINKNGYVRSYIKLLFKKQKRIVVFTDNTQEYTNEKILLNGKKTATVQHQSDIVLGDNGTVVSNYTYKGWKYLN